MLHLRGAVAKLALAGGTCLAALAIPWMTARSAPAQTAETPAVTFNRDIAPIVFQHCASCHHSGEAGPFPLLTYQEVKKRARQIAVVTKEGFMPPWLPEPQPLKFAGELRLSQRQIELLQRWVEQGTPEGKASELPPEPKFVSGWHLGTPDMVLTAAKAYTLPASGTDQYWNFIFPVPIENTNWVKAVEIRPGDKRLVHHANILVDRTQSARRLEAEPGAGFEGMEMTIASEVFDPDSHFLFWKPGTVPYVEPEGMALRMDRGADLVLNTHLQPSGKPETIQPSLGIYFTAQPATKHPMLLQLENDSMLDIPAGARDFTVADDFVLPVDVEVMAVYPHAHYLGKDILAYATLPQGEKQQLIHIPRWDLNWQAVYRYEKPLYLPKGTRLSMRYRYDNSEDNLANPNRPPQPVKGGNRSSDEMAHFWLQVLPIHVDAAQGDPRMILLESLARHSLEKNPNDFQGHYNLAAMLQAKGEAGDAATHYQAALRIRPGDAVVENALGASLITLRREREAVPHLLRALQQRPDYFDAHYNLGFAYVAQNQFEAAAEQFEKAAQLRPDDADAEANLGGALAESGRRAEAIAHFRRALEINPEHALARENLEALQNDPEAR